MNWDEYFMRLVYLVSSKSKDDKTHIGSVLVRDRQIISTGFNGIPIGVFDPADYATLLHKNQGDLLLQLRGERPTKYFWYVHAEANSVFLAARNGISTKDTICYTQGCPCHNCSMALIQGGIKKIIIHKQWPMNGYSETEHTKKLTNDWKKSIEISRTMLYEAEIEIDIFNRKLDISGYLDGERVGV